MTPERISKSTSFRIKTQPSTSQLLAEKNKYHRYDHSLFHKTKFHLRPLKQNPELFIRVDSIGKQLQKIKRTNTINSTVNLRKTLMFRQTFKNGQQNKNKNVVLPHSINIRDKLMRYLQDEQKLQKLLENENKVLVTAKKWIIFDMEGGKTLKGYKQKKQHDIASLTKVMTFYTAYMIIQRYYLGIERFELMADEVDSQIGGTKIKIKPETIVTLEDMLYAMMLGSANNAATIIGANLGSFVEKKKKGRYFSCYDIPSEQKQQNLNIFLQLMNSYAEELGMTQTKFFNVHGMQKNLSSAKDIALLTSQCYKIPLFSKIVATKSYSITLKFVNEMGELEEETQNISNTNKLLWMDTGCIGGKTGCNSKGGESLTACYEGNIIVVVLGCASRQEKFADAQKLVNWLYSSLQ